MIKRTPIEKNYTVLRIAILFWLIGWFIKGLLLTKYLFYYVPKYPIVHPLFPELFLSPKIAQFAYIFPSIVFFCILTQKKIFYHCAAIVMISCSCILAIHLDTFNDATFVTSFWVGLWIFWFSFNLEKDDSTFRFHACVLAQCIVGMFFLGGFVGKLTPEYFNGDVLFNIHIIQENHWPFDLIKEHLTLDSQRSLFVYISIGVIITELFLALSVFFPTRFICLFAPFLMSGMTVFRTWMILSVLGCLIGMLWACLIWEADKVYISKET